MDRRVKSRSPITAIALLVLAGCETSGGAAGVGDVPPAAVSACSIIAKRREILLNQAIYLAVAGGICITILLLAGFVAAFLGFRHEPGAGALFILALCLLVGSLVRFLQDIRISLSEHDHHH